MESLTNLGVGQVVAISASLSLIVFFIFHHLCKMIEELWKTLINKSWLLIVLVVVGGLMYVYITQETNFIDKMIHSILNIGKHFI